MYTKGELRVPEYETSFLTKCSKQINSYFGEKNTKILAMVLKGEKQELIQDRLVDGFLAAIDDMVEVRKYNNKKRYCINVKVHSLPLTHEEEFYIYENWEGMMDLFWHSYIVPWIEFREQEHYPNIYSYGRSGGWLGLDRNVIEDGRGYYPVLEEVQRAFEDVKKFKEGWDSLFKEMKGRLDEMIEEGKVP